MFSKNYHIYIHKISDGIVDCIVGVVAYFNASSSVNSNPGVTVHAHTNHLLIGMENASKSGKESAPPLKAVFQWADSVTVLGLPVNSNTQGDAFRKRHLKKLDLSLYISVQ